jgi:hypothetical protein
MDFFRKSLYIVTVTMFKEYLIVTITTFKEYVIVTLKNGYVQKYVFLF